MNRVRDHVVLCVAATITVTLGLFAAALGANPWLQLFLPLAVAIVCTRLLAPVYFGWREPGEVDRRRRRP